jgi:hypothetical protein
MELSTNFTDKALLFQAGLCFKYHNTGKTRGDADAV